MWRTCRIRQASPGAGGATGEHGPFLARDGHTWGGALRAPGAATQLVIGPASSRAARRSRVPAGDHGHGNLSWHVAPGSRGRGPRGLPCACHGGPGNVDRLRTRGLRGSPSTTTRAAPTANPRSAHSSAGYRAGYRRCPQHQGKLLSVLKASRYVAAPSHRRDDRIRRSRRDGTPGSTRPIDPSQVAPARRDHVITTLALT